MHRPDDPQAMPPTARLAMLALLVLGLLATAPGAWAQQTSPSNKAVTEAGSELIAVLDMDAVGATKAEAVALTERLRESLLKSRRFKLVDRSQMKAILDEQALQQTGCTSQECAVQVGQILGVRKIVASKVIKVSASTWLLSGIVVDVETAQTLDAESVVYDGNLVGLLQRPVDQLGLELAHLGRHAQAPAARPVVASLQPVPLPGPASPPRALGTPQRVAIFPALNIGIPNRRSVQADKREMAVAVAERIAKPGSRFKLIYSYYPEGPQPTAYDALRKQPVFSDLKDKTWRGVFSKVVDRLSVQQIGQSLGVDFVVMGRLEYEGLNQPNRFDVYVLDVASGKLRKDSGYFGLRTGLNPPAHAAAMLLKRSLGG
ncbi:MAG TPA: CsgG/HfaB family protein [bacterium]|nr:CsgG/HfaB family protein [bacterium]